jgi:Leucine-rich repeat (LRR) protein
MKTAAALSLIFLLALQANSEEKLLDHVGRTLLLRTDGSSIPRIEKDVKGNVVRLYLSHMQLTPMEFKQVGELSQLRHLDLFHSNVKDPDLHSLRGLSNLTSLNLTSTEITDAAVNDIIVLKSLKSLCLGNVVVTPDAVSKMKMEFQSREQAISLGYSMRKQADHK